MSNIKNITDELHNAYRLINERFFNNELPEVALTIQSSGKRLSMGWCTTQPIWTDKKKTKAMYEINIAAEYLAIEFMETIDTLMHEMVHLYCKVNNIQDCSRGGTYHNKKFRDTAIKFGFIHPNDKPDKKVGYSYVKLSEETKTIIDTLQINREVFKIARQTFNETQENENPESEAEGEKPEPRPSSFLWTCQCDNKIRSTKINLNIICGECRTKFVCTNYKVNEEG